jgi:two-component system, OmpR family, response regulator
MAVGSLGRAGRAYSARDLLDGNANRRTRARAMDNSERLSVLIVEDDPATLDAMRRLLALPGYTVAVAATGEDALRLCAESPPDVVFVDLQLPGIDGFEVASRLRATPAPKRPLLVAVTGHDAPEDRQRSVEAGIDLHLAKPVTPVNLLALLERMSRVLNLPVPAVG